MTRRIQHEKGHLFRGSLYASFDCHLQHSLRRFTCSESTRSRRRSVPERVLCGISKLFLCSVSKQTRDEQMPGGLSSLHRPLQVTARVRQTYCGVAPDVMHRSGCTATQSLSTDH